MIYIKIKLHHSNNFITNTKINNISNINNLSYNGLNIHITIINNKNNNVYNSTIFTSIKNDNI